MKNYHCEQCGKTMNPIDYLIGSVCLECCRKNQAEACGKTYKKGKNKK